MFGFTETWKNSAEVSKGERYDHTKRKRKFEEIWSEKFQWVEVEEKSQPLTSSDADIRDFMYRLTVGLLKNMRTNLVLSSGEPIISELNKLV